MKSKKQKIMKKIWFCESKDENMKRKKMKGGFFKVVNL
jgi:hypothetical protein